MNEQDISDKFDQSLSSINLEKLDKNERDLLIALKDYHLLSINSCTLSYESNVEILKIIVDEMKKKVSTQHATEDEKNLILRLSRISQNALEEADKLFQRQNEIEKNVLPLLLRLENSNES
ncbi:hypothetical protein [Comamonas jiangduensis]|uniref:Uncharacterized protein n=1 Tax=Comamonas jiangduensis TaxID=1194168 RepID=A0ABV4IKJ7_9BURK